MSSMETYFPISFLNRPITTTSTASPNHNVVNSMFELLALNIYGHIFVQLVVSHNRERLNLLLFQNMLLYGVL